MPTKPTPPTEEFVDPDELEDLGEDDELPDEFDLHDLEPVFTEEAPLVILDEELGDDEALEALPEDELLGAEAPLEWDDDEDEGPATEEGTLLDDEVDWAEMLADEGTGLPALDWSQEIFIEELDRTVVAELDPTAESTTWFKPDVSRAPHRLSFQLGGQPVSIFPAVMRSRDERLRIGRDVLANRFLVRSS